MSDNKLQKKLPDSMKEKTQYVLAFGVIAAMLLVADFPKFVIVFFGIFAYFLWRTFTQPSSAGVREVFEFYLSAHEILRDDERRWFGFEIQEVVGRGESILQRMQSAPPLIYFTLGALYNKSGNHKAAANHLAYVLENEFADEKQYAYATPELKNYVNVLRKIEREPSEAPQTSAAIRALERMRRTRGKSMLDASRVAAQEMERAEQLQVEPKELPKGGVFSQSAPPNAAEAANGASHYAPESTDNSLQFLDMSEHPIDTRYLDEQEKAEKAEKEKEEESKDIYAERKPISELLRDIYDK